MIVRRICVYAMIALASGLLISCGPSAQQTDSNRMMIVGAGATFPAPLYKKWAEVYPKEHKDIGVEYRAIGSGEGIKQFIDQKVDFGASDAAMRNKEIAKVDRGVKLVPATAGIIVLAYNLKGLNGRLKLPGKVYTEIFLGKIKYWTDPRITKANPGLNLPFREIVLVTRQDSSGTTFAFTNHLSAVSDEWRTVHGAHKLINWPGVAMRGLGNGGVAAKIKISEGSIGYVEYGYASRGGLSMAWLENKAGHFIKPDPASGQATLNNTAADMPPNLRMFLPDPAGETSYPLVTYTWIMLYGSYPDPQKATAVKDFLKWGITKGQEYSEGFGYCRLPQSVVDLGTKAIEGVR